LKKKKRRKITNTAGQTMAWLREMGYLTAKVERWNPFAKIRVDLFGFADIVAIREDQKGVLAVQTTSYSLFKDHKVKMRGVKPLKVWLKAKNPVWLVLWKKVTKETPEGERYERKRTIPFVSYLSVENNRVKFSTPLFAKEI
jgi:hypothetical protein